ncbi:hypothetical protein KTO53_28805, partial [Klebsiella quasipneumoniae]|nr:hypothetical protein [Klebsiella quasipneumoniae]
IESAPYIPQLNNRIIRTNIAYSERHDADDSNIVQDFALDRFTIFGYQCLSSQRGNFRPAAVLDQNLTSLLWLQGDIQYNVTTRTLEN